MAPLTATAVPDAADNFRHHFGDFILFQSTGIHGTQPLRDHFQIRPLLPHFLRSAQDPGHSGHCQRDVEPGSTARFVHAASPRRSPQQYLAVTTYFREQRVYFLPREAASPRHADGRRPSCSLTSHKTRQCLTAAHKTTQMVTTTQSSPYIDSLRAGRSGNRIPVLARFSAPVHTGPVGPTQPPVQWVPGLSRG